MENIGTSIIFANDNYKILLFLRDSIPSIKYANSCDILGGNLEKGESPEECIVREMKEELNIKIVDFRLFEKYNFPDRLEYTFWKTSNLSIDSLPLNEGQRLKWFTQKEAERTHLAFDFNVTVDNFFITKPFLKVQTHPPNQADRTNK